MSRTILPSLRGTIGSWVYYSSLMTADEVAKLVKPAKAIREAKLLDDVLQRDLKNRKDEIAAYLLTNTDRFFNSLIIGVFEAVPDWYEFKFGKHSKLTLSAQESEYLKDSMGLLVFNGEEKMFAIDGQHRAAGIQIASLTDAKSDPAKQVLNDDQFSVIFVAHIDDALGKKRTRKLFSDININAKPVASGDRIIIDEEDIFAIVTRRIYASFKYFEKGKKLSITENAKLKNDDSKTFTNLLGIYSTCKALKPLYRKKRGTQEWDEENVVVLLQVIEKFLTTIIEGIPDYRAFFIDKSLQLSEARKNNAYLLFRPIGLKLLARLYVHFLKAKKETEFLKSVNKIDYVFPSSPFNHILWKNGTMEAKTKYQDLAFELSLYLLNELPKNREGAVLASYREVLVNPDIQLPTPLNLIKSEGS